MDRVKLCWRYAMAPLAVATGAAIGQHMNLKDGSAHVFTVREVFVCATLLSLVAVIGFSYEERRRLKQANNLNPKALE